MLKVCTAQKIREFIFRFFTFMAVAQLLSVAAIKSVQAHTIERIEINRVAEEAEIQITFDVRIQYLREASLDNGDIHLYFNILEADPDRARLVPETRDSPPSEIVPHFTVDYPSLDSSLAIHFERIVNYRVQPGQNGRSISIFIPVIKPDSEPSDAAILAPKDVEREAKQLIDGARDALDHDQFETAIEKLNRLLNLPPNKQSQIAQKLIGEAREGNGEFAKARVEYQLYLKLYPDADDARQVKNRLAQLPEKGAIRVVPQAVPEKKPVEEKMMVFGSFSQNYYKGMSHIDSTTLSGLNVVTSSLDSIDQSTLLTSLDITGRKRTETTDTRIVVRDDYKANFLNRAKNENRLNALYVESGGRDRNYLYRLGRQSGGAGGVSGRFDGALLTYSPNPVWHINGVMGTPVEFLGATLERKKFSGLSVDITRLPGQWGGGIYYLEQNIGKIKDRQAIGLETHYFDEQSNFMGLLEYDKLFKLYNIAMLQGNWTTETGNNYLLLADHRKSPTMQLSNALAGQVTQSVTALVDSGVTVNNLIQDAKTLTATSNLFMVGMTHPYSKRLRLGADFRVTNISGTGAAGIQTIAAPGTGNIYIVTAQAIGNNLLLKNDLGLATASYIHARSYKGQSLTFSQIETIKQRLRVDASVQFYNQNDILGIHQTRITPSLKFNYTMKKAVSLDLEGGVEYTHNTSAISEEKISRQYFYLGYRWDFS